MKRPVDVVVDQVRLLSTCKATEENLKQRVLITGVRNYFINKMENIRKSTEKVNDPVFTKYEKDIQTFMLLNRTYKGDIRSVRGVEVIKLSGKGQFVKILADGISAVILYVDSDIFILNRTDYDGRTALHIAVAENHDHLVKYFLEELKESIKTDIKG
ncbi:GLS [Mytilus edulis]|uniref:GlsA n=1 Tax=Mytilus edulis TaxID=6550 RepID=A0A8S3TSU3_MYTED|nr:GLS [Mytilus edulis]